jgi:hypothetical protein
MSNARRHPPRRDLITAKFTMTSSLSRGRAHAIVRCVVARTLRPAKAGHIRGEVMTGLYRHMNRNKSELESGHSHLNVDVYVFLSGRPRNPLPLQPPAAPFDLCDSVEKLPERQAREVHFLAHHSAVLGLVNKV